MVYVFHGFTPFYNPRIASHFAIVADDRHSQSAMSSIEPSFPVADAQLDFVADVMCVVS